MRQTRYMRIPVYTLRTRNTADSLVEHLQIVASNLADAHRRRVGIARRRKSDRGDPNPLTFLSIEALRCVNPTLNIHPDATSPFLKLGHLANYGNSFAIRAMSNDERSGACRIV
jgi:hypothetical protein